jgi:hypothetical protein
MKSRRNGDYLEMLRERPNVGLVLTVPAGEQISERALLTAENVILTEAGVEKMRGWRSLNKALTVGEPVRLIHRARFWDGTDAVLVGGPQYLYSMAPNLALTGLHDEAFAATAIPARWEVDTLGNELFLTRTDGLVALQKWTGSGDLTASLTAPRGKFLTMFQEHLILGAMTNFGGEAWPLSFVGSGNKDAADWETTNEDTDAIKIDIAEGADSLIKLGRLDEYMPVWKRDSLHLYRYIGGDNVYARSGVVYAGGALCSGAVSPAVGDRIYYAGKDDIWQWTPAGRESIGAGVWRVLRDQINADQQDQMYTFRDEYQNLVFWSYPTGANTSVNRSLVFNETVRGFTTLANWPFTALAWVNLGVTGLKWSELSGSWKDWRQPWRQHRENLTLLGGDGTGNLYRVFDPGELQGGGADINSTIETGDQDYGDRRAVKAEHGAYFDCEQTGANPLELYVGTRMSLNEPVIWNDTPYPVRADGFAFYRRSGRWFRHRLVKRGGWFSLRDWHTRVLGRGTQ